MAKTLRSLNKCKDCGHTWYPRGKNRSLACPSCGSQGVVVVTNWTAGTIVAGIALLLLFAGASKDRNAPIHSSGATEQQSFATTDANQATLSSGVTGLPGLPLEERGQSAPSLASEATVSSKVSGLHAADVAAPGNASATVAPSSESETPDYERTYSDEEISALEDEKQYHENDPIVRSRLGIPSRETHKLIR